MNGFSGAVADIVQSNKCADRKLEWDTKKKHIAGHYSASECTNHSHQGP